MLVRPKQRVRLVPLALAALSLLCGIAGPNAGWYLGGHAVALAVALTVPVIYWWLSRGSGRHNKAQRVALAAALLLCALVLAFAEAVMLSYGSAEGAIADIGGTFLWLVGGAGSLATAGLAAYLWPRQGPEAH